MKWIPTKVRLPDVVQEENWLILSKPVIIHTVLPFGEVFDEVAVRIAHGNFSSEWEWYVNENCRRRPNQVVAWCEIPPYKENTDI